MGRLPDARPSCTGSRKRPRHPSRIAPTSDRSDSGSRRRSPRFRNPKHTIDGSGPMNSPATGIAYSFALRTRWVVPGIILYLSLLSAGVVFTHADPDFIVLALILLFFVLAYLLHVFTF